MPVGKIELGFHITMAGETETGILFFEEIFRDPSSVDLVTVIAPHGGQFMDSSLKLKKLLVATMAFEAWIRAVFCVLIFEGKDESFSFCLGVFGSRTVTGFTSFLFFRNFWVSQALPVGVILFKPLIKFLMAFFTGLGSHIPFGFHPLLAKGGDTNEG